ncbi:MAG: tRNA (adenosine(37)-N6)-threonylcarbamoyltransferase complex dimerization subunit type 1 TsaB [Acidimicrobiales bacterium]
MTDLSKTSVVELSRAVLGIETATNVVSVAIGGSAGVLGGSWVGAGRGHVERLAPAISNLLDETGVELAEVGVIAVDVGPGLFTGIRVGVATAKSLGQGLGVQVIAVSSLELLAWMAIDAGWRGSVCSVVDARRGEVFVGSFDQSRECLSTTLLKPHELSRYFESLERPLLAVGNGVLRYRDELDSRTDLSIAGDALASPSATALVSIATEMVGSGIAPSEPNAISALYMRDADAKVNWVRRDETPVAG